VLLFKGVIVPPSREKVSSFGKANKKKDALVLLPHLFVFLKWCHNRTCGFNYSWRNAELFLAKVSALATMIILMPVALGIYAQGHLIRGLTGGALK
jgi:ABC-type glycerol-3-phosphate transport system permease component